MVQSKINTIFMNSRSGEIYDPQRVIINLSNRLNLKRSDKYATLSNLSKYYTWKNIKKPYANNKH